MARDDQTVKDRLQRMLADLDAGDTLGKDGQQTVELDQQSVGRLSRMDALQNQAMAAAQQRRRDQSRRRIAAAMDRLAAGEYGYCTECGDEIAERRLALDPAIPTCMACARAR